MYLENRIQEINDKINILIKTSEVIVIFKMTITSDSRKRIQKTTMKPTPATLCR